MKDDNIIKGYQGIMDLDLSFVDEKYKSIVVKQHLQDIYNYKLEQSKMPEKLRYENTTLRALKIIKMDKDAAFNESRHLENIQKQKDAKRMEIYRRICEMKNNKI
jgi:hypothetical protein